MIPRSTNGWAHLLLMPLCEFSSYLYGALLTAELKQLIQELAQTMGGLVNHNGALLSSNQGQSIPAFPAFCREETLKTKPVRG
jgi:hypothetical protein